ncbi:MAG: response regulator transcription factor [Candidatus Limnocylindria bacterium]
MEAELNERAPVTSEAAPRFALVEANGGLVGQRLAAFGWAPAVSAATLGGLDAGVIAECEVVVVVCSPHVLLTPEIQAEAAHVAGSLPLVVVVTAPGNDAAAYAARLGWRGFVESADRTATIAQTISSASRGEVSFPPSAATVLAQALATVAPVTHAGAAELTPRQRQIVTLLAHGATDAEIATTLRISESTAHKHVQNARRRLRAKTRSQLVATSRDLTTTPASDPVAKPKLNLTRWPRLAADERGQSLVEVALTLPLLLLIVIGLIDVGRVYGYAISTSSAASEAALFAARTPTALAEDICQRARDELGAGGAPAPCSTSPITVVCERGGSACTSDAGLRLWQAPGGADVRVTVTHTVSLFSGYLIGRAFGGGPVQISGFAAFTGLSE